MDKLLFVGIGGFLGANARFLLSGAVVTWLHRLTGVAFPYGTIAVNVIGSFLLAIFTVMLSSRISIPENTRLLIGTGFFGAFTTFSTYANESVFLIRQGDWPGGLANIILTNGVCILGVFAGIWLASR